MADKVPFRVLVVDDDERVRRTIARTLARFSITDVSDGAQALPLLQPPARFDLVLTDLTMPQVGGMEVVRAAAAIGVPAIMFTGDATVDAAVKAMRLGAVNFLTKPVSSEALEAAITDVLAARSVARATGDDVVGSDPSFRSVLELVEIVAETDATVLLAGETGTGKEVMAKLLHRLSSRKDKPFVAVNCGGLDEQLLNSDLFGHRKGSFTGADRDKVGRVAEAEGGTLFLDEIGDMPMLCQAKILRLVQERTYEVVGDPRTRNADVRIVAATHKNLVKCAEFRQDLYYRLSVVELALPPLRERPGDIADLVMRFIAQANQTHRRNVTDIEEAALDRLRFYGWPGNVRELAHVVERMVIFCRGATLAVGDLPRDILHPEGPDPGMGVPSVLPARGLDLKLAKEQFESEMIRQALEREGGNKTAASKLLGMNRTTLVEWLRRHGKDGGGETDASES